MTTYQPVRRPARRSPRGEDPWANRRAQASPRRTGPGLFHLPGQATSNFWLLLAIVVVINMIGLIMILSSSAVKALDEHHSAWSYFEKQAMWTVFGTIALLILLKFGQGLRHLAMLGLVGAAGLLALVMVPGIGVSANGATRWIGVGQFQIQPSEIAKLALILFVADWIDRRSHHLDEPNVAAVVVVRPVMLALGVIAVLIMAEPNLGTTIVVSAIVLIMLFAAGAPGRTLFKWTAAMVAAATFFVFSTPWRAQRFFSFRHPTADTTGAGYQTWQSQLATAGGGTLGRGLGDSRAKWNFLPEAHTDFIYAVLAEEFGLVGATLMVGLFLAIAALGIRTAMRARSTYEMLVAVGITTWFVIQAFVNIGAVVGILPITGVPLPFVSFGGSSLLVTLAATGLLLNVARHPATDSR